MNFSYEIKNRWLIVKLGVEVDHHHAQELRKELDDLIIYHGIKILIFDFAQTTFMDSSGIGIIMGRYKQMKLSGGDVGLIHVSESIGKLLKLSGIYRLVNNYRDAEEAIKKLI